MRRAGFEATLLAALAGLVCLAVSSPAWAGLLNDDLEAHWTLDETAGNFAELINGNTGTPVGSPHGNGSNGVLGGALDLSGSSDYVEVAHHSSIDFSTESFTVAFWLKTSDLVHDDRMFQKGTIGGGAGGTGKRYEVYYDNNSSNDQIRFVLDDNSVKSEAIADAALFRTGDFVHVVAVRDTANDLIRLYAGGTQVANKLDLTGDISQSEMLRIANDHQGVNHGFTGGVDDFAIWRRALQYDEIAFLASGQQANQAVEVHPAVITGLTKTGGDTDSDYPEIVLGGLQDDVLAHVDRTNQYWRDLPDYLLGADYIKTENDDKGSGNTGEAYEVTIGAVADLYAFVDVRFTGDPPLAWLTDGSAGTVFAELADMVTKRALNADGSPGSDEPSGIWHAVVGPGTYTFGEQGGYGFYGIAADVYIPEPTTLALLALGGLLARLRRRRA